MASDPEERGIANLKAVIKDVFVRGKVGGEHVVLTNNAIERLTAEIEQHLGTPLLFEVVKTLLQAATSCEKQFRSPNTAREIREIAEKPEIVASMAEMSQEQMGDAEDALAKAAGDFGTFAGRDTERRAPAVGDAKPEGSLTLDAFNVPRRG